MTNSKLREARYSFDEKCLDLADHFLGTSPLGIHRKELAQHIQNQIEAFLEALEANGS